MVLALPSRRRVRPCRRTRSRSGVTRGRCVSSSGNFHGSRTLKFHEGGGNTQISQTIDARVTNDTRRNKIERDDDALAIRTARDTTAYAPNPSTVDRPSRPALPGRSLEVRDAPVRGARRRPRSHFFPSAVVVEKRIVARVFARDETRDPRSRDAPPPASPRSFVRSRRFCSSRARARLASLARARGDPRRSRTIRPRTPSTGVTRNFLG